MSYSPNEISREHVLAAVKKIEKNGLDLINGTRWAVVINEKDYPPKEILKYAHEQLNGELIWETTGGEATNKFLRKLGFKIINKDILDLIEKYKVHLRSGGLDDEIYKWEHLGKIKGHPNLQASNFAEEVKSVKFLNLVYHTGISVIYHLAKDRTDKFKGLLGELFDEKVPLSKRIIDYDIGSLKLYREIVPDLKLGHFQDERTIATLLTFHNPSEYTFYKSSFYTKYCKFIKETPKGKGEKYPHYLELIKNFAADYIVPDSELITLINEKIPKDAFHDENHILKAQDILYQSFDHLSQNEKSYWRVGTTDSPDNYWNEMKNGEYVAIGWPQLGDLSEQDIKSKSDIDLLLKSALYKVDDNKVRSRKAGEIYNYYRDIKAGDIILAQDGKAVQGIGVVEDDDDYFYVAGEIFPHRKKVSWIVPDAKFTNSLGLNTTVYQLDDEDLIHKVEAYLNNAIPEKEPNVKGTKNMQLPLNMIIYGPPGTGKTHRLIKDYFPLFTSQSNELTAEQVRSEIVSKYTWWQVVSAVVLDLKSASVTQILEHPLLLKKDSLSNQENPRAMVWSMLQQHTKIDCANVNYSKRADPLFFNKDEKGSWTIDEQIMNNEAPEIKDLLKAWTDPTVPKVDSVKHYEFVTFHQSYSYEEFVEGIKPVMSSELGGKELAYDYEDGIFKKLCDRARNDQGNKYALFIDEINRGNVSQIFGELITLIEDDKREVKPLNVPVKLLYTKKEFSVPPNLHIIGTMNTADRSVEALDTALRRRFSFEELLPDPNLIKLHGKTKNGMVEAIDLVELLTIINRRVEKLKGKDHLIGHSFFLSVSSLDDLKLVFHNKIIPLLQEYFFGDYSKIGLILGTGFFENGGVQSDASDDLFAKFNDVDGEDFKERATYRFVEVTKLPNDEFKSALTKLMKK